jgi:hypothetical protein
MQLTTPGQGNNSIKKLSWWHESVIDWMLLNPNSTLTECAATFNVTLPWLSRITNSHLFKERLALRRREHSQDVSFTVIEKLESLADLGVEALIERVATERDTMPIGELRQTAEMALASIGYTTKRAGAGSAPATGPTNVQVNVVSADVLKEAAAAWTTLSHQATGPASTLPAPEHYNGSKALDAPPSDEPV